MVLHTSHMDYTSGYFQEFGFRSFRLFFLKVVRVVFQGSALLNRFLLSRFLSKIKDRIPLECCVCL